jgi:hypothetical protein
MQNACFLPCFAVDVVGKYRYEVRDPLGGAALPLLLDVLLVGRTKMLRLHSCLWLQNRSGMRLQTELQLGSSCRMPVVLGPGDKLDSLQQLHLRVRLFTVCPGVCWHMLHPRECFGCCRVF